MAKPKIVSPNEFVPTGILQDMDSVTCILEPDNIPKLLALGNFPDGTVIICPSEERADKFRVDWACFYDFSFLISFPLPFFPLIIEFFSVFHFAPSQLLPSAWKVLHWVSQMVDRLGIYYSVTNLMQYYQVSTVRKGRILLQVRNSRFTMVLGTKVNDMN